MKGSMRKALKSLVVVAGVAALFCLGAAATGCGRSSTDTAPPAREEQAPQVYTCAMHPQIRQAKPGKCPICGMDLVPATQKAETNRTER